MYQTPLDGCGERTGSHPGVKGSYTSSRTDPGSKGVPFNPYAGVFGPQTKLEQFVLRGNTSVNVREDNPEPSKKKDKKPGFLFFLRKGL